MKLRQYQLSSGSSHYKFSHPEDSWLADGMTCQALWGPLVGNDETRTCRPPARTAHLAVARPACPGV
eukprot:scaffold23063_cov20-Prasinocladus_malaysianus.AAC.2